MVIWEEQMQRNVRSGNEPLRRNGCADGGYWSVMSVEELMCP